MGAKGLIRAGAAAAAVALAAAAMRRHGLGGEAAIVAFRGLRDRLGFWAAPLYVGAHTVSLALCLPYAVFFEAGASLLFGFLPGVICVFFAKVLGASLSFWIGRAVFRSFKTAMQWVQSSKYFHVLARGVEQDGWKFVLLARFSPLPSYVINYAMAATDVGFLLDFLLPTVIGCLPMILQNTSLGSLAGAAVASSSSRSERSRILSYIFPLLGITSSILISWRIKKYTAGFAINDAEVIEPRPSTAENPDANSVAAATRKKPTKKEAVDGSTKRRRD